VGHAQRQGLHHILARRASRFFCKHAADCSFMASRVAAADEGAIGQRPHRTSKRVQRRLVSMTTVRNGKARFRFSKKTE
jgi:hypothetical protein